MTHTHTHTHTRVNFSLQIISLSSLEMEFIAWKVSDDKIIDEWVWKSL